jgi:hypothetical protein
MRPHKICPDLVFTASDVDRQVYTVALVVILTGTFFS